MCLFSTSAKDMQGFGVSKDEYKKYEVVRKALSKADIPVSKRRNNNDGAQLPAQSFDPIIMEGIEACNKE